MKKFIVVVVLCLIIWIGIEDYRELSIKDKIVVTSQNENDVNDTKSNNETIEKTSKKTSTKKTYPKAKVVSTYRGYDVIAKLEVPAIDLESYVLKNHSKKALYVSVTHFYGAKPNTVGNFCISGHNYIYKNMFHNLKKLKKGDKLYISDNKVGKVEYKIYSIYKVNPKDTSCLEQDTNGKKEVTLITCTYDSKKRIIVKAREKI